jgi:hypothetical protein
VDLIKATVQESEALLYTKTIKIHLLNNHIADISAPTSAQNMVSRSIDQYTTTPYDASLDVSFAHFPVEFLLVCLVIFLNHRSCAGRTTTEYKVWPDIPNFLDTGADSL